MNAHAQPTTPQRRAIGDGARVNSERSFWHMLFPLGGFETRWDVQVIGEYSDGYPIREYIETAFEFSADWLRGLVDMHARYAEVSGRHGMPPIPLPVSMQHLIEERIAGMLWDQPELEDLARAGSLYDLYLCDDPNAGHPLGLYGLIEWTPKAIRKIDDGEWMCLSPTTWWDWEMTEPGVMLDGESIQAVGLVDRGALDSIGTTRDRLPLDAFPRSTAAPTMRRIQRATVWGRKPRLPQRPSDSTPRGADATLPTVTPPKEPAVTDANQTTTEPTESTPRALTAEDVQGMIDASIERSVTPSLTSISSQLAELIERGAQTEPVEPAEAATEPSQAASTDVETDAQAIERATMQARVIARDAAIAAATDLVKQRKLLPGNVAQYIERSLTGGNLDEVTGDYGSLATMTGTTATGPAIADDGGDVLTESAALKRARTELGEGAHIDAVHARCRQILLEARDAGQTVDLNR